MGSFDKGRDHVQVFSTTNGDTRRYRSFHLIEQFRNLDIQADYCQLGEGLKLPAALCARLVVFQRVSLDGYVQGLLAQAQRVGALSLFDFDDLIFDDSVIPFLADPVLQQPLHARLYKQELRNYRRMFEACQAAIAATAYLAERARALGKPAWVHRNAFSFEMLRLSQQTHHPKPVPSGKVVIGYASGTPTHNRDFATVRGPLQRILKEFPQAELHVIGHLDPGHDWGSCQDRVKHIPFCPWQSLPGLLAQLDINLAPLELDNPFCQAKSEIKYVEAGLVKVPTIAAATEAFQAAIHDGDNGRLALTPDDWEQALAQLVLDGELRLAMGERAYLDTLARYHPLVRARELLVTLNAISRHFGNPALFDLDQDAQPRSPGRSFIVNEPQLKPLWQRVLYTLRYRGLQIFLLQVLLFLQVRLKRVAQHLLGQFQPRDVASL